MGYFAVKQLKQLLLTTNYACCIDCNTTHVTTNQDKDSNLLCGCFFP